MEPPRVVVEVSSTVRRLRFSAARTRELAEATLAAEGIRDALISVAFVGRTAITRMNREYLRRAGPTDVIAFGMGRETPSMPAIGDIYICPEIAERNARHHGVTLGEELARLVVHGTLHVAGHDHPEDESRTSSQMWKRQERILATLG
ncbi:MAG: rRNA maturation RNase YbeY [Gemmatimonadaceae bacterium]